MKTRRILILLLSVSVLGGGLVFAQEGLAKKVKETRDSYYYTFYGRSFHDRIGRYLDVEKILRESTGNKREALDVNVYGEVADSDWFTNRNGRDELSTAEIKHGTEKTPGMDLSGKLVVTKGKIDGASSGFWVKDARGDRYLIKFDFKEYPEMATGAESITSRLFHAIGYNVPQYTVEFIDPEQIEVEEGAYYYATDGFKRPMTIKHVRDIFEHIYFTPEGKIRASASRFIDGDIKGPFLYRGRRKSDPADTIPHEHMRVLRSVRVFAAWLSHFDIRHQNTMDAVVTENGRTFVKHYLIDFGATLGSATNEPQTKRQGREYFMDWAVMGKEFVSLGIWKRPGEIERKVKYPEVGYYETDEFEFEKFDSEVPTQAYLNLTDLDGYWAAKIVMSFTEEQIRAAVEMAKLSDKKAEDYLVGEIMKRRDKVGKYFFEKVNPCDNFYIKRGKGGWELNFEDLLWKYNLTDKKRVYGFRIEKENGEAVRDFVDMGEAEYVPLGDFVTHDAPESFVVLVYAKNEGEEEWGKPVRIFLEREDRTAMPMMVRIDREK